jgi:hypothetical protein
MVRYGTFRILYRELLMNNNRQIVDMIERANDDQPFCTCGRHTTPVEHEGVIWLECASLDEPRRGRLGRILAALAAPSQTRVRVVDVPSPNHDHVLAVSP